MIISNSAFNTTCYSHVIIWSDARRTSLSQKRMSKFLRLDESKAPICYLIWKIWPSGAKAVDLEKQFMELICHEWAKQQNTIWPRGRYRIGPKIEPWGTPHDSPVTETQKLLPERWDENHLRTDPDIPTRFSQYVQMYPKQKGGPIKVYKRSVSVQVALWELNFCIIVNIAPVFDDPLCD